MPEQQRLAGERGTTITELLAVLAMMGLLAVPIALMLHSAGRAERSSAAQLDIDRLAERAAAQLRKDLRNATVDPTSLRGRDASTTLPLIVDDTGTISWTVIGDDLRRREADAAAPTVDMFYGPIEQPSPPAVVFAYFDEEGTELRVDGTTRPGCIALVEANVTFVDAWAERATTVVVAPRRGTDRVSC